MQHGGSEGVGAARQESFIKLSVFSSEVGPEVHDILASNSRAKSPHKTSKRPWEDVCNKRLAICSFHNPNVNP